SGFVVVAHCRRGGGDAACDLGGASHGMGDGDVVQAQDCGGSIVVANGWDWNQKSVAGFGFASWAAAGNLRAVRLETIAGGIGGGRRSGSGAPDPGGAGDNVPPVAGWNFLFQSDGVQGPMADPALHLDSDFAHDDLIET